MAPNYRDDEYGDAPEVNPQQHAYIYPVNDSSPPFAMPSTKGYDSPTPLGTQHAPVSTSRGWKRWWILALIGLLLAIVAGLVGGFIGVAIQKGRETAITPPAASSSSVPTNGSSSAITPPPNQPADTLGTIVHPSTGCDFPNSKERRRIANTTVYSRTPYTTVCNSGWSNAGLAGIWTLTPSDCIEACIRYNVYTRGRPSSERQCVGGGFVPDWTNQTTANKVSNGAPFNCYLQSDATGIKTNDREKSNTEVVALCLEGQCNGAGTA